MNNLSTYNTRDELSKAVAEAISGILREGIEQRGQASFVASGGGTPKPALDYLAVEKSIDWGKVSVTLSDERIAPPEADVSNAVMVREHLFQGMAEAATFLPLETTHSLDGLEQPFDVVLLGMGGDGHFASIFPDGKGMNAAIAPDAPVLVETTPEPLPPEAPYPRLSLSLPVIRTSRHVFLMISGDAKKEVLDLAASDSDDGDLPVRLLLKDPDLPLRIFWAP